MNSCTAQSHARGSVRLAFVILSVVLMAIPVAAQTGPAKGSLEALRDPELEVASKHNLDVARWYMDKRKAYEGARDRLKEILTTYPDFSRIDEVIFLLGEANRKMNKDVEAARYYRQIVKDYPGSRFFKQSQEHLAEMKVPEEKPRKPRIPGEPDTPDTSDSSKPPSTKPDDSAKKKSEGSGGGNTFPNSF
ncbi:MAG TPA: tetratricopeptide repeat protein [Blastocatellia bacterium]|nr:tetratricopeptide repeat protein [Blastocatellia bacterium]